MYQIISKLIEVMIHTDVYINHKKTLAEALESAFHFYAIKSARDYEQTEENKDDQFSISRAFSENILSILIDSKAHKSSAVGAILILQSYLAALEHDKRIIELSQLFFNHLLVMNNTILADILETLQKMTNEDFNEDSDILKGIIDSYEVEWAFIECLYSIMRDCKNKNGRGLELFAMHGGMGNLIFQIIGIVGTNSNQCQQVLISMTGVPAYDNLVNTIKMKSLEILNNVLSFWIRHNLETRLLANNLMYLHYMILTLAFVTEKDDYHEYLEENDEIREMVIQLLENITITTKSRLFTEYLSKLRAKIIVDILFMFLASSESEQAKAIDEPKEFMNYALDVSDKQESKTVKTQAAKWLEAFSDKVDGSISFISMFSLQWIDYYINNYQENDDMKMNFIVLIEFFKSRFLSKNRSEIIIETSIMALTIISYLLPKRQDVIKSLDFIIKKDQKLLTWEAPVIVKARMALFYGYFTDILFKDSEEKFKECLEFLLKSIDSPEEDQVVALQCWESLITIASDKNIIPRIKPLVSKKAQLIGAQYQRVAGWVHSNKQNCVIFRFFERVYFCIQRRDKRKHHSFCEGARAEDVKWADSHGGQPTKEE
jgi:hypothetical protein